jgi:hypothetical protein
MNIIFDEKDRAEYLLENGFSSFMSKRDLIILAKYYKYLGNNIPQIKNKLIEFCEKYNPDFNEVLSRSKINDAIKKAQEYGLRMKININITKSEFELIKNVGDYNRQKILFVTLVLAKYYKYNKTNLKEKKPSKYDKYFYVQYNETNIFNLAKVNVKRTEKDKINSDLEDSGLINTFESGDSIITFVDEESPVEIIITNLENMISFYPWYCEKCGKKTEKKPRHNLCEECRKKYRNIERFR